jgi:hypothetical protein
MARYPVKYRLRQYRTFTLRTALQSPNPRLKNCKRHRDVELDSNTHRNYIDSSKPQHIPNTMPSPSAPKSDPYIIYGRGGAGNIRTSPSSPPHRLKPH